MEDIKIDNAPPAPKKEMNIKILTELNTEISGLIDKLNPFDKEGQTDITTAIKLLKEAGTRIAQFYYKPNNLEKDA